MPILLTEADHRELKRTINPMQESQYQGVDIYLDTINFINEHTAWQCKNYKCMQ